MRILMWQCDNPKCKKTGMPEDAGLVAEGKEKQSPYGWLTASLFWMGTGPDIKVTVCETECLVPAVNYAIEEHVRRERGDG